MKSWKAIQILPVSDNFTERTLLTLPMSLGVTKFYLIMDDMSEDHVKSYDNMENMVFIIEKAGYKEQEKITISTDFGDIDDCVRKLGAIMLIEKDAFEICFNATFEVGLLNVAGVIACSIASSSSHFAVSSMYPARNPTSYIVRKDILQEIPLYTYSMLCMDDVLILRSLYENYGQERINYNTLFKLFEKHPDMIGKKRTARYGIINKLMTRLVDGGYVDEIIPFSKGQNKYVTTFKGKMVCAFYSSAIS